MRTMMALPWPAYTMRTVMVLPWPTMQKNGHTGSAT
jgi:hypothetical protein